MIVNALKEELDLPLDPIVPESGYFMTCDISQTSDLIPSKFKSTHDFEDEGALSTLCRNRLYMPDGKTIPLDLAFCRWMALFRRVVMMPCVLFYGSASPRKSDRHVRLAVCKGKDKTRLGLLNLIGKHLKP